MHIWSQQEMIVAAQHRATERYKKYIPLDTAYKKYLHSVRAIINDPIYGGCVLDREEFANANGYYLDEEDKDYAQLI